MRAKNVTFQPLGLNNRLDPVDMLPTELVTADNVDLRKGRSVRRRKGGERVTTGSFYSFWDNKLQAYVGKDTAGDYTLHEFNTDFTTTELTSLAVGAPLAFEQVNAVTVFSNGVDLGFIVGGVHVAPTVPTVAFMRATVAGEHLSEQNGRLLIGQQNSIYFTITHDLEAMDRRFCQIPLPKQLTMMVALKTGVWISYEGVIAFLRGAGPDEYKFELKADFQAVRGTGRKTKADLFVKNAQSDAVIFMTQEGPALGSESGELLLMTKDRISAGISQFGTSLVRESDGYTHFIGSVQDAESASNQYAPKNIVINAWRTGLTFPLLTSQT